MFSRTVFAKSIAMLVGLTAASLVNAQAPHPTPSHASDDSQLAAKNPIDCVPLESLNNTYTPPDIYLGVSACIRKDDYRTAGALFMLAGINSRFDIARVLDNSSWLAAAALIMNIYSGLEQDKRVKFDQTVGKLGADPNAMTDTCRAIRKIGHPDYYPDYMVVNGANASIGKPGGPTMKPNFDAQATWDSLLTNNFNCHDAATTQPKSAPPPSAKEADANDSSDMKPGLYEVKTEFRTLDGANPGASPVVTRQCFEQAMIDKINRINGSSRECEPKVPLTGNRRFTEAI